MSYDTKNNTSLKGLAVWIQCTWCRVFTEPVINKGLCIRSYDRKIMPKKNIGTLTGNYYTDSIGVVWLEANLLNCNRRPTGWFRERDIWHSLKGIVANTADQPYISSTATTETKKSVWLGWLTGGITLLSFLH
jgi:hypothetical protein